MCLHKISDRKPRKKGVGYKVVDRGSQPRTFHSEIFRSQGVMTLGNWNQASNLGGKIRPYPYEFHIFTRLKDARSWGRDDSGGVIVRVEYRNAHTQGTQRWGQWNLKVVVALEMKIISIVEEIV